jgi:hypothetical protein
MKMKSLSKYPKKRIIATIISTYILGGISTFLSVFPQSKLIDNETFTIVGGIIYLILLILSCIFAFKRREYGVEGISRIHKDNDYSDITKHLNKAKHTIEIIAYHGNNLLYFTKSGIIDALKRDVDVKLLIAQKDSILLKEAQILEGSYRRKDQERAWEVLEEIKREANGKTCSIRYYRYHTQARYALVVIDGKWAWWTPYHPGLNVPETSSFVLVDTGKKSIIQECKKHFRTLWVKYERETFIKNSKTTMPKPVGQPDIKAVPEANIVEQADTEEITEPATIEDTGSQENQ